MSVVHGVGAGGRGGGGRKPDRDPTKKPPATGRSDFEILVDELTRVWAELRRREEAGETINSLDPKRKYLVVFFLSWLTRIDPSLNGPAGTGVASVIKPRNAVQQVVYDMPVNRPLKFRNNDAGRIFVGVNSHRTYQDAIMAQIRGFVAPNCDQCSRGKGRFLECVRIRDPATGSYLYNGACMNCHWGAQGTHCSHRKSSVPYTESFANEVGDQSTIIRRPRTSTTPSAPPMLQPTVPTSAPQLRSPLPSPERPHFPDMPRTDSILEGRSWVAADLRAMEARALRVAAYLRDRAARVDRGKSVTPLGDDV